MNYWLIAAIIIVIIIVVLLWLGREKDQTIGTDFDAFQRGLEILLGTVPDISAEQPETFQLHAEQFRSPGDTDPKTSHVFTKDSIGGDAMDKILRGQYNVYKDKTSQYIGRHERVSFAEPTASNLVAFKPNFQELNPDLRNPFVKNAGQAPIAGPSYNFNRLIDLRE